MSIVTGEKNVINSHFLGRVTVGGHRFPVGELSTLPLPATRGIIGACCPLADAVFIQTLLCRQGIQMAAGWGERGIYRLWLFAHVRENKGGGPECRAPVNFELLLWLLEGSAGVFH